MKKAILSIIVVILIGAGIFAYIYLNRPPCFDGYGSSYYATETELRSTLAGDSGTNLHGLISGMNNLAIENYRCGETTYRIKDGGGFKEVSSSNFQKYISEQKTEIFKIHQSGNSPWFASDLTSKKQYLIKQREGRYVLEEALRL